MNKWNVYKVFANGNRAKMPYTEFEADNPDYFYESILPTMSEKLQNCKWQVIDDRLPEEAIQDQPVITCETDLFARKRNKFLSALVANKFPDLEGNYQSCLMFIPETNWKWCWCVAEASSLQYVGQLSERFDTAVEAEQWIKAQIE